MWINVNLVFSTFILSVWWNYHWCKDFAHVTFSDMSRRVLFVIIFIFCGLTNHELYRICSQAYCPFVLRLFFSYYVLNPTGAVPSVHLLLRAESHLSCSTSSFVITYRIPRVVFDLFIRYYMLNPTCPAPLLHLLLHTESQVSCSICSFVINAESHVSCSVSSFVITH
jgi:hypothetical protein